MAQKGLGKGLSALIAERNAATGLGSNITDQPPQQATLSVDHIVPGTFQPRSFFNEDELASLAESITANGVVQPILVRPRSGEGTAKEYEIIAGERRWRAAQMANLSEIPVIIMALDNQKALEIAIVENVQRQDLQPLEEAEGYQRLLDEFSYTQEKLSGVIGKSRSVIANSVRLLSLPADVKEKLSNGQLSAGHGRALLTADDPSHLAAQIVKRGLNVRQAELLAKQAQQETTRRTRPTHAEKPEEITILEQKLASATGLDVVIQPKKEGGEVRLTFHSGAELERLVLLLTGEENHSNIATIRSL